MVRFNIIGYGFLDVADPTGIAFKTENQQWRFCDISLGRTVEFSVPATDHNRQMLQFGEDPSETGELLRRVYSCQLVYDGGQKMGTIAVTGFSSESFTCVFTIGNAEWIEAIQDKQLSECVVTGDNGVLWDSSMSTVTDANVADNTELALIVRYENGYNGSHWQLVPSININAYLTNIFSNLGIPFSSGIDPNYWLVAGSMKGGGLDHVKLTQTSSVNFYVSQAQNYLDVVDIELEWATADLFGVLIGGGSATAKAFKALENVKVTFPNTLTGYNYLIRWNSRLRRCKTLGCTYTDSYGSPNINGMTIDFDKDDIFFIANRAAPDHWLGINPYYGWQSADIVAITTIATVERNDELQMGENWFVRNNHPNMTVFEFLRSVALATGAELFVDGETGVILRAGSYGGAKDFKALERVVSTDGVTRRVECWGNGVRKASIAFDAEDYVSQPIISTYDVFNEQNKEKKETKSKFSEGNIGTNGVLIQDVETGPKFVAKKWTIAYADKTGNAYLQRVDIPSPVGYLDIADNSTVLVARCAVQLAEFFALSYSNVFLWRGVAYVWTNASWSEGIMTLTLQRVSELNQEDGGKPTPELVSIKAQFNQGGATIYDTDSLDDLKQYLVVTAYYSDSSESVVPSTDYVLSGSLVAPSSTITVTYNGFTDTFTVQVTHQYSASDYVQDGLVLLLDGIEQGNVPERWTDLASGHEFTPYGGVVFNENNVAFDGVDDYLRNNEFIAPESASATIEAVFEKTSNSSTIISARNDLARIGLFINANGKMIWSSKTAHPFYDSPNIGSVSINGNGCIVNGNYVASSGSNYYGTSSAMVSRVGCKYSSSANNSFFSGKIYCIRIYNRQLTEAEVLANYAVDQQRFSI